MATRHPKSRTRSGANREFCLASLNHVLWSSLPVASRYLQVFATPVPFDGQGVLATAKATSAILVCSCGPLICPERKVKGARGGQAECADGGNEAETNPKQPVKELRTKVLFAILFGTVATCRACLNIASAKFTLSYNVATINSLTPVLVSIGDAVFLKAKLPWALWPCVVSSCVGCALIGLSQSPLMSIDNGSSYVFTGRDAVGCALQFASMCFSAAARLLMKRTEHILTRDEMVQTNNVSTFLLPLFYTLVTNRKGWGAFLYMTPQSFVAWATIAVLVYTLGSTGQMSLVRSMGPGMYTSLSAIRVLGSVFLSAAWLDEPVRNWLEWVGLLITMVTMTLYTIASTAKPAKEDRDFVNLAAMTNGEPQQTKLPFQSCDDERDLMYSETDPMLGRASRG